MRLSDITSEKTDVEWVDEHLQQLVPLRYGPDIHCQTKPTIEPSTRT